MTEQIYTDKEILADALTAEKAATNNYNAFANECVHDSVRDAILHCLEQEHCIQEDVFNMMHQRCRCKQSRKCKTEVFTVCEDSVKQNNRSTLRGQIYD